MLDNLRPLGNRILVQRIEDTEKKTKGGIYIPDMAREDGPNIGEVIAVGPGRSTAEGKIIQMEVRKGDHIFYGKFAGTDAGKNLIVLSEDDVLGILEK
jgi:chaperonin GroES